jgi:CheY-like chemotaxis protein
MATTSIILVVEHNETEQFVLKELLRKFDYDSHMVATGEEAITALGLAQYSAILMNITLPGIDGYECTRRIRLMELKSGRRTPILALTARARQRDHDASKDAGTDDWMSKPFEPEDLRKMLLRYVYDPSNPNLKTLGPLSTEVEPKKQPEVSVKPS